MNLGGPVSVKATAGATSFTGTNNQATTGNIWQDFSFTFVPTATTANLSFQGDFNTSSNPFYIGLDNVSVNAVPEPSTFFLGGAGLAGLMAWARRRKSGK